jgi:hypothetical protein
MMETCMIVMLDGKGGGLQTGGLVVGLGVLELGDVEALGGGLVVPPPLEGP